MPSMFIERLPLPSLQVYTSISIVLLSCSVYYALKVTSLTDHNALSNNKMNLFDTKNVTMSIRSVKLLQMMFRNHIISRRLYSLMYFMVQEPICIWPLINMAYCCLILIGKCIQKIVFGELRVVEKQHLKDKFWNFVFYKFIFIFGVLNVQYMEEVLMWCSWFSLVGFFNLLSHLCKERFEYLSFSPTTPKWTHIRLFALILAILATNISLSIAVGMHTNLNTFFFMAAECALVTLQNSYNLIRYILHLWDTTHDGIWERKGTYIYYCELIFELICLIVDFLHHIHMLLWGNIFLSMASLIICMQLRFLFNEIQRKLQKHKNYLNIARHIENNYPFATQEEIDSNSDDCAICWDRMESARKLPCGHMFHVNCLRSWLEQVTTCPTCRKPLVYKEHERRSTYDDANHNNLVQDEIPPHQNNQTTNHFFHFDGSRYVSWFPSFSVEVSHTSILGERQSFPSHTSQLESMAHQVLQMFPHMPYNVVLEDLRNTRSIELTIENILDERLVHSTQPIFPSSSLHSASSSTSSTMPVFPSTSFRDISSTSSNSNMTGPFNHFNLTSHFENVNHEKFPTQLNSPKAEHATEIKNDVPLKAAREGCRFSKSSSEREKMLALRKEELIKRARNKYISRINLERRDSNDSHSSQD